MNINLKNLRQTQIQILQIKNISADNKLPREKLMDSEPSIRFAKHNYDKTLELDKKNEKLP